MRLASLYCLDTKFNNINKLNDIYGIIFPYIHNQPKYDGLSGIGFVFSLVTVCRLRLVVFPNPFFIFHVSVPYTRILSTEA